ncbi:MULTISPECIES: tetratricopeptide repeat protein [Sphingobacterium]|uniref:tetratricopeptide repeat protein n=1 Tax=Sphingobacterium TaxID=28453 RepID=UPI00257A8FB9|nr:MULTISPECIES: hypothetical protein [Sphingobacterium]
MARTAPKASTLRQLFALSGNECAFPGCRHALVNNEGVYIAQLCHIEAAERNGQRYNEDQTDEERRAFENLILLCHEHHKVTDDVEKYGVSDLKLMKSNHEQRFLNNRYELEDEALDQVVDSIHEKLDHIIDQNNRTQLSLHNLTQEITIISSTQANVSTNRDNLYSDILKIGIDLRSDNKYIGALSFFQKFEKDKWNNLSNEVRFKLLANTGVTLLDMGRNLDGASYFLKINELGNQTLESLAYTCLGYAILKKEEQFDYYFNKAISLGTDNPNLWLAFLLCKGGIISAARLQNEIPSTLLKSSFIIIKLLELYNAEGKLEEAKELFWKIEASIEREDFKDWQIINIYVGLIVSSVLTVEKLQLLVFTDHELKVVIKAIALYDRIIALLEKSGADKILAIAYYNRALCYMALSKRAEAERDLERSWNIDPYFSSFKGLFIFHLKNNRFERCELLLQDWKNKKISVNDEERFVTLACEARLFSKKGDTIGLERILMDAYDKLPLEYKSLVLDNLILNGVELKDYNLVIKYSRKLISEFPEYIYGYIGLFAYNMKNRNFREALSVLREAKNKKYDSRNEAFIWMQLADGFCELKEYNEALIYFEKLKEYNSLNAMTPRFAECHYYLQNYEKVVALLGDRDFIHLDFNSRQFLFWSYHKMGLNEKLKNVLEQGLKLKASKDVNLFRNLGARYYAENKHFNKAVDLILSIDDFSGFDVMASFDLVGQLSMMGYVKEAFDLAYKLRVLYYDNFEAQKYYFDLSTHHGNFFKNKELFLDQVGENTLVVLTDVYNREYKYYLAGDNMISDGVILEFENQLWGVLLNKARGQEVSLPNTIGVFKILEIHSKHLVAFRDSLFLLENKYADKAGIYFTRFG